MTQKLDVVLPPSQLFNRALRYLILCYATEDLWIYGKIRIWWQEELENLGNAYEECLTSIETWGERLDRTCCHASRFADGAQRFVSQAPLVLGTRDWTRRRPQKTPHVPMVNGTKIVWIIQVALKFTFSNTYKHVLGTWYLLSMDLSTNNHLNYFDLSTTNHINVVQTTLRPDVSPIINSSFLTGA